MTALMQARSIVKTYGATQALKGVDFAVEAGKVNVLIGENGAGKSTLMRILAGVEQPTRGELLVDGAPVQLPSVREAAQHGIGMVHQELNLCPNLSVAENIFLLRGPDGGRLLLDRAAEQAAAAKLLQRLGQDIDPARTVGLLSVGEQQIVEIAKALAEDCRVLIFDEPTSALSDAEVDVLFRVIGDLKRSGVGIVYISHKLEELLRVGDTITILRDGEVVARADADEASVAWIVEHMLGSTGKLERADFAFTEGPVVLSVEGATLPRSSGGAALYGVDMEFGAGAVVAIYGLLGSGRTEAMEVAFGARQPASGVVRLKGEDITALSIAQRVKRGLLFVSEDRKAQGIFANFSVGANMGLSDLARFAARGVLSPLRERGAIAGMISRLGVKTASAEASIGSLSGGNQQKVLIGRALMPGPAALLLDEPSRGIDVGARAEVFRTIRALAADGLAVIFTSSDVLEALAIADRIIVMSGGRVTLNVLARDASEQMLIAAANASSQAAVAKV
ncbi:sugar ABC transporter ATP-binding protein [Novosphingobium sp. SL115]|uniref:sugar ABC transporter ATP-binding protein n=1 Tax=Novosphingobium sp. SL115 TaxID=2995150 RepID=UPI0022732E11|nr:sugar ABC transporter ATP-binding protein [Novosphingobium sp. SL115]MCY1670250.1 sugar ABC transporter ATP-binding protein [Novosphingobium sp. SL115]